MPRLVQERRAADRRWRGRARAAVALALLGCGSPAAERRDGGGDAARTGTSQEGGVDLRTGGPDGRGPADGRFDLPGADARVEDAGRGDAGQGAGRGDAGRGDAGQGAGRGDAGQDAGREDAGQDARGQDAGRGTDGGDHPVERLFVATYLGGLSSFTVDDAAGGLVPTPGSPHDVGAQLYAVTVHPSGRFVYASDLRGTLLGYAVDPGTGALAHLAGSPVTIGSAAIVAAVAPSGRFLYVGDGQSLHVFAIDQDTGALAQTADSPVDVGGQPCTVAFHPSGRFLFASFGAIGPLAHGGIRTFALDAASGAPREVPGSPLLDDEVRGGGLVSHPNGKYLYVGSFKLYGFAIDQDTGALTALSGFPVAGGNSDSTAIDLAIDPQGVFLYATDFVGSLYGYRIDAAGTLTAVAGSPFDGRPDPYSVAVDRSGRFVYVGNDDSGLLSAFSLDRATGALSPVPGSPFSVNGLQPELALGLR